MVWTYSEQTKAVLAKVISVSLMFDEASDIQIHQHFILFVNALLVTGEVKTLTLALQGGLHVICYMPRS
jgi:hypothetical protein